MTRKFVFTLFFLYITPVFATDVFTYPSISRHDPRYWDNHRFLYEKSVPFTGDSSFECLNEAVDTLQLSMPFYSYYYGRDTVILTDIPDFSSNIAVVVFSRFLNQEASILPSGGDTSAPLFLSSLLKKMCPGIISRTSYEYQGYELLYPEDNGLHDYLVVQYGL